MPGQDHNRKVTSTADVNTPGLLPGRLAAADLAEYQREAYPPLRSTEAAIAAMYCLYCYDPPCVRACPCGVDIPRFIARIADGNPLGAGATLLAANPFGGTCARVCPTEVLCEQACVRGPVPVAIAGLQRFATDAAMEYPARDLLPVAAEPSGRRVAVVGAGPAGLTVATGLARAGHGVTVFESRTKLGGLNEYGLAGYKMVDNFAAREIDWLLAGLDIEVRTGVRLGDEVALSDLLEQFDAVFLGLGTTAANSLGLSSPEAPQVRDAIDFLAEVRQGPLSEIPMGRNVVVIGGGPTAVDAAVAAKLLGAREVTIAYRRSRLNMKASVHAQERAAAQGVTIRDLLNPLGIRSAADGGVEVRFAVVRQDGTQLVPTDEEIDLPADLVLLAIGQHLDPSAVTAGPRTEVRPDFVGTSPRLVGGRIATDESGRTSVPRVWAGGDCVAGGRNLTASAVAAGMRAVASISAYLATDQASKERKCPN